MLKWLRTQSWCKFNEFTVLGAVRGCHLAALTYLCSAGCDWHANKIAHEAASSGNIAVVEWLRQQQSVVFGATAMASAACAGQTAMCAHLRSIGCGWNDVACSHAAAHGRLDTLRWLLGSGCPWSVSDICGCAAQNGRADVLDYLLEQGAVMSSEQLTEALNAAGTRGTLQTVQWCRQRGAEWPAVLGYTGIVEWTDACLAWARANGCAAPLADPDADSSVFSRGAA
jgi:hypothetical protein